MENELDLEKIENQAEENLKVKNRFEKLSAQVIEGKAKVEMTLKEKQEAEQKVSEVSKERDFYKDFSTNISKYPNASAYQDKILEKVKAGYSTEDAMVSVLAKEGKLQTSSSDRQSQTLSVEGGSAPTTFEGTKSIKDMTAAEKLAALGEADKRGELMDALRG